MNFHRSALFCPVLSDKFAARDVYKNPTTDQLFLGGGGGGGGKKVDLERKFKVAY